MVYIEVDCEHEDNVDVNGRHGFIIQYSAVGRVKNGTSHFVLCRLDETDSQPARLIALSLGCIKLCTSGAGE